MRFGLCCIFHDEPIRFRRTTATRLLRMQTADRGAYLSALLMANAQALQEALLFCRDVGIGAFRINSQLLPVATHPAAGYSLGDLPDGAAIETAFRDVGTFAQHHDIRTTFHPDQFVVLNSPKPEVVRRAIADLEMHAEMATWVNADVITIHGGGGYSEPEAALARLARQIERLPDTIRSRLALENDDRVFSPAQLLPICHATGIPLIYDIHHHRCLSDHLHTDEAFNAALGTWNREPVVHISSPRLAWGEGDDRKHSDYIDPTDVPCGWRGKAITVEVEAKAKELAVIHLISAMAALDSCNSFPKSGEVFL